MTEEYENEIWLSKKQGKLALFSIDRDEMLSEHNTAHWHSEQKNFDVNSISQTSCS